VIAGHFLSDGKQAVEFLEELDSRFMFLCRSWAVSLRHVLRQPVKVYAVTDTDNFGWLYLLLDVTKELKGIGVVIRSL
jgi:hypothetical protein